MLREFHRKCQIQSRSHWGPSEIAFERRHLFERRLLMSEPPLGNVVRVVNAATGDVHLVPTNTAVDIRGLKQYLAKLSGRPRFQLRLLRSGTDQLLQDGDVLGSAELQLVVMSYVAPTESQEAKLGDAVQRGDVEEVEQLLQLPRSPDPVLSGRHDRLTPMFLACRFGHAEIVSLLLEARASCEQPCKGYVLDFLDTFATSPLGAACAEGHVEIVRLLLQAGAPLYSACGVEHDRKSEPVDLWPFDLAMLPLRGHKEVAQLLLAEHRSRGVPGPLTAKEDKMTLEFVEAVPSEMLRFYLDAGTRLGAGVLVGAVQRADSKIVHWLLEASADMNGRDNEFSVTPLGASVRQGNIEMARLLLGIRADVDASFERDGGGPILKEAICNDDAEMVRLLVESRADVGREYKLLDSGRKTVVTPLQHALARGREEIVQIIQRSTRLIELQYPEALKSSCNLDHEKIGYSRVVSLRRGLGRSQANPVRAHKS